MDTKKCSGCKGIKSIEDFYRHSNRPDGRSGYCKVCESARKSSHKTLEVTRKRYKIISKQRVISTQKWQEKNQIKVREYYWKKQNIMSKDGSFFTFEKYKEALIKSDYKCMICDIHQSNCKAKLVADHNHKTGIFRGILCRKCNLLLGHIKNYPLLITRMNEYIKENE